ncbi:copper chaperone for superoxide dismutase, chloroplastic-like isoform X2 [Macadamia integrifolia]|uniref:copper chaperone for superoxide dismutase, chloroplastic-like isoform X2 n=1 Tax=Macadamia integrifolia TaxID=60698 RepID=UPI001C4F7DB5|nr:copper chaperone for superoxide dismutase, chloroplastic-like isoform X2 [Macadamia integrifolia]
MAFLRTLTTTAASVLPAAVVVATVWSSSDDPSRTCKPFFSKPLNLPFPSTSILSSDRLSLSLARNLSPQHSAVRMDSTTSEQAPPRQDGVLPELMTEFMVDMTCDGCVSAVKNKLMTIDGVKGVEADLSNQVVRVTGSSSVKTMLDALEQTGRKARLIGQGNPGGEMVANVVSEQVKCTTPGKGKNRVRAGTSSPSVLSKEMPHELHLQDFLISAAVAEFKGPQIFGVVRLAQVNMELARIEASFSGLTPGKHGWSINEFGDLTKGAASTGKVFNPTNHVVTETPLGDLGTLDAQDTGEAFLTGVKQMLRVSDLIGRSIVVNKTEDKSDAGIAAAVIARSAGIGENYKRLCACDGTTIWEASNNSSTVSKVYIG